MLARALSLEGFGEPPLTSGHRVILLVSSVHRGTLEALRYAQSISYDITAVHVAMDREESAKLRTDWALWGKGIRLVILQPPGQMFLEPLLRYIDEISNLRQPNETITVVVPQFVPERWIFSLLHMPTSMLLRLALLFKKDIVITDIPYQVP